MKFWRRSELFAKSRQKSGNYAQYATAAQFMTIAFIAKFAAQMTL
jgi:hypothetical protein